MPRQGKRRKKSRPVNKEEQVGATETKNTPRCFVLKRGHVGDRIKDLVKDFRNVMMPNCAKSLRESKHNRIEDFIAVAAHYNVTHLVMFTATKSATYMKLARLPHGPTLTFKVDSFTLSRDIKASQKRPKGGTRDYTSAPLQVLNGLGGLTDAIEREGGGKPMKGPERALTAEMLRGLFPAIDVPTFNQAECRRAALFSYDREEDVVHFRHFHVGRKQTGIERGVSRLLKTARLPNLGRQNDISDYVLGGGGNTESEMEDGVEVPMLGGNKVAVRLTESGPRLKLLLVKAEEGVCGGGVIYHRFQTKTPTQEEVLKERARQRSKLKERNSRLESKATAKLKAAKAKRKDRGEEYNDSEEEFVPNPGESDSDGEGGGKKSKHQSGGQGGQQEDGKKKRFHPFGWKKKSSSGGSTGEDGGKGGGGKSGGKSGGKKGGGKGKSKGGGGKQSSGQKVLDRFSSAQKRPRT
mmetsp:Transcript_75714/g.136550  ORF Transcript_75714/g.136550 Transcript_75714/m.136550 type:complete len:466 (+) Transcript_75714:70-1467(+)